MDMFIFHRGHTQFRSFIYRNLHQDCWSVKALEGPNKGRVVLHAKYVAVSGEGVDFRVNEAGRQRVLREERKNVHAGVVGSIYWADVIQERYDVPTSHRSTYPDTYEADMVGRNVIGDHAAYRPVAYNPYKYDRFVFPDNGSDAFVDNDYNSVVLDAAGKVYVMDSEALGRIVIANWQAEKDQVEKDQVA